jgi:hypothetical protein
MTLKLLALDDEDLTVISAHMQDAVFRVADVDYTPRDKHFTIAANRFAWDALPEKQRRRGQGHARGNHRFAEKQRQ